MHWEDVAVRTLLLLSVAVNVLLFALWGYALKQWKTSVEFWDQAIRAEKDLAERLQKLLEGLDP